MRDYAVAYIWGWIIHVLGAPALKSMNTFIQTSIFFSCNKNLDLQKLENFFLRVFTICSWRNKCLLAINVLMNTNQRWVFNKKRGLKTQFHKELHFLLFKYAKFIKIQYLTKSLLLFQRLCDKISRNNCEDFL